MDTLNIKYLKSRPGEAEYISRAKALTEKNNLLWEDDFTEIIAVFDSLGQARGVAQIKGNLIKEVSTDKAFQGRGIAEMVVSAAVNRFAEKNIYSYYVFTRPDTADIFKSLGLKELSRVPDHAVFLEGGSGITEYLQNLNIPAFPQKSSPVDRADINNPGPVNNFGPVYKTGSVVLNCNPMTKGHLWLIKKALAMCSRVFVFIVTTDKSVFSSTDRIDIVTRELACCPGTAVNPTGPYMVSDYLFPAYFTGLQAKTDIQARLDAHLFAGLIAPALKIEARFTGSEPFCPVTLKYNQAMKKIFPAYNIDFHEFERIKNRDQAIISASRARKLLALDVPYKELEQLKELKDILVPASLGFLKTSRGRQVIDRIRSLHREHKQARKYVKELDTPIDKALDTPIDVPVDGATNADS